MVRHLHVCQTRSVFLQAQSLEFWSKFSFTSTFLFEQCNGAPISTGQWKLLVNIDEKHTAFYKSQPLISFVKSVFPNPRFTAPEKKQVNHQLSPQVSKRPVNDFWSKIEIFMLITLCLQLTDHLKGLKIETLHLGYPRRYRIFGLSECPDKKMIISN